MSEPGSTAATEPTGGTHANREDRGSTAPTDAAPRAKNVAGRESGFRWRVFVWASLLAALVPGFGLGALLFVAIATGTAPNDWWPAAAQAHGHAQLFGFAGMMALGVAFHFLPRLRGARLAWPRLVRWVLALYGGGVFLRAFVQGVAPLLPAEWDGAAALSLRLAFAGSGPFTLAGATLGAALLARSATLGPPLKTRAGFRQVAPLLAVAGGSFLLALVLNAGGTLLAGATGGGAGWLVPPPISAATARVALLGWLVPLAMAFSARTFPLFLWTRVPSAVTLYAGLVLLLAGLLAEVPARLGWRSWEASAEIGRGLEGLALLWWTVALGALGPKSRPRGKPLDIEEARLARAAGWALKGAFAWLAAAGALMALTTLFQVVGLTAPPEDAERHALGAGFLTLLIVGMALRLLPGFAGAPRRRVRLGWARAAILGAHGAALLRVGPVLYGWLGALTGLSLPPAPTAALLAASGVAGALAVICLGTALYDVLTGP